MLDESKKHRLLNFIKHNYLLTMFALLIKVQKMSGSFCFYSCIHPHRNPTSNEATENRKKKKRVKIEDKHKVTPFTG